MSNLKEQPHDDDDDDDDDDEGNSHILPQGKLLEMVQLHCGLQAATIRVPKKPPDLSKVSAGNGDESHSVAASPTRLPHDSHIASSASLPETREPCGSGKVTSNCPGAYGLMTSGSDK